MRLFGVIALLALPFLAVPEPASAGGLGGARAGAKLAVSGGGVRAKVAIGKHGLKSRRGFHGKAKRRHHHKKYYHKKRNRFGSYPFVYSVRERDVDPEPQVVIVTQPQVSVTPPAEPVALDPKGSVRFLPARTRLSARRAPVVGGTLPLSRPHVALDWRRYDLPEPAPGQAYARVGRDVLLIEPATRTVLAIVPSTVGADDPTRLDAETDVANASPKSLP